MADSNTVQKIIGKIKDSSNVLVALNSNPTVDELSAALAITIAINKLNKHATAVFSGDIPPAISFLEPEKTFENTVNSLRDFIIALDKEKADHLRYKVVDDVVKIFITPYRTTIDQTDLDFSQGDFNVELVIAIGVKTEDNLDHALASHGRILHDATVITMSLGEPSKLGGLEWVDGNTSSFSEMMVAVVEGLKGGKVADSQIATALLTGIVAATDRFSNERTSPDTMGVAARLMSAGANQQLIATNLEVEADDKDADAGEELSLKNDEEKTEESKADSGTNNDDEHANQVETETNTADNGVGSLSISHMPVGDVDAVSEEIARAKSDAALDHTEAILSDQASESLKEATEAAVEPNEQQLADQLASIVPAAAAPPIAELQKDIVAAEAEAASLPETTAMPSPARTIPAEPTAESRSDIEADAPSLGGTLNATTEQAEEDKRREIEDDRNKTILSHGSSSYMKDTPLKQAPMNGASAESAAMPDVSSVFDDAPNEPSNYGGGGIGTLQLPTSMPRDTDARAAIDAALAPEPFTVGQQLTGPPQVAPAASPMFGPLPPLPPMPDFSTLPPLPEGLAATPAPVQANDQAAADAVGEMLLDSSANDTIAPSDPGQFRIPGQ